MKNAVVLVSVIATLVSFNLNAQSTSGDAAQIASIARQDAKKLRLTNSDLKKLDAIQPDASSDYFKPTAEVASKPSLLNDSTYVTAFKKEAFKNTLNIESVINVKERSKMAYTSPAEIAAKKDAAGFTLPAPLLRKFKKDHLPYTSDYFKPTAKYASDQSMLADTSYVKTFRYEAYNQARHQRSNPVGHAIVVGSSVVIAVAIIAAGIYELDQY